MKKLSATFLINRVSMDMRFGAKRTLQTCLAVMVAATAAAVAQSPHGNGDRGHRDMFENLTEEERKQVREGFGEVWNDPAVLQARDEVRRATEAYHKAMKEAMESKHPEVAKILNRVKKDDSAMRSPGGKGMSDGKGRRSWGGGDKGNPNVLKMIQFGPFIENLNEGQKAIYKEARTKAGQSEEVKKLVAELTKMRLADEARREKRTDLIEQIRTALYQATMEADPRVKEFMPEELPKPRGGGGSPKDRKPKSKG